MSTARGWFGGGGRGGLQRDMRKKGKDLLRAGIMVSIYRERAERVENK